MNKTLLSVFLILVLCFFASAAVQNDVPSPISDVEAEKLFIKFLHKYEKFYGGQDYKKRFDIFKTNLQKIAQLNHLHNDNVYGVTKFMDMSEEDFKKIYLSKQPMSAVRESTKDFKVVDSVSIPNDIPDSWEWVSKGAVTPVKNQGACGSCWSFSTTGNVEGQHFLKTGKLVALSEQNLVDCDHTCDPADPQSCDAGCNGGLMLNAFSYIKQNGGIDTEESYPYEGVDDKCRFNNATVGATISGGKLLPKDEDQLKAWLYQNGPIAVALNAEWLQFYIGGISDPLWCSPTALDHGVLIVGYGTAKAGITGEEKEYWLVKNSWGASWGEKGYFRIRRGTGKCGINTYACSAEI